MNPKVAKRESNIELFRIICMFAITLGHLILHTGALESSSFYIRLWAQFLGGYSKMGVNGFVMITAWFMCSKQVKLRKVYDLYKNIWWYSIFLGMLGMIFMPERITLDALVRTFLPFSSNHWWFVSTYIAMMLLAPGMNLLLEKATKKQMLYLVLVGLTLFSLIPTFTTLTTFVKDLPWFCYLYLTVGFIKKYGSNFKLINLMKKTWCWVLLFVLIYLSTVVFTIFEKIVPFLREGTNFFTGMYILPMAVGSMSIFLCFLRYRVSKSRIVNWLGGRTLTVYLIQSNVFFTVVLWEFMGRIMSSVSWSYPLAAILAAAVIEGLFLMLSVPIEGIRQLLEKWKPIRKINCKVYKLCEKVDRIFIKERSESQ
ncbi:MAG: acyltransferase family protein [Candidatus Limivicinus sp.]|jgi:hypothetical protein